MLSTSPVFVLMRMLLPGTPVAQSSQPRNRSRAVVDILPTTVGDDPIFSTERVPRLVERCCVVNEHCIKDRRTKNLSPKLHVGPSFEFNSNETGYSFHCFFCMGSFTRSTNKYLPWLLREHLGRALRNRTNPPSFEPNTSYLVVMQMER
jgi:hypothetical protein